MDRALSFNELNRLFAAHGCACTFNPKTQFIKITLGRLTHFQHAHKGRKDCFSRNAVRAARRKLLLDSMPDADFYAPLD